MFKTCRKDYGCVGDVVFTLHFLCNLEKSTRVTNTIKPTQTKGGTFDPPPPHEHNVTVIILNDPKTDLNKQDPPEYCIEPRM